MSLSPSAIESLAKHDFGWQDLRCEAPGHQEPADGSIQDHYCRKHLREELSRRFSSIIRTIGALMFATRKNAIGFSRTWQLATIPIVGLTVRKARIREEGA